MNISRYIVKIVLALACFPLAFSSCFDFEEKPLLSKYPGLLDEVGKAVKKSAAGNTSTAKSIARTRHATVVFNDRMWILGGREPSTSLEFGTFLNDVRCSEDGVTWTCVTSRAAWGPRMDHSAVAFNGRIWIMGGTYFSYAAGAQGYCADVWSSADGANWAFHGNAPWGRRALMGAAVHGGRIYVIAGNSGTIVYRNDVWSTADGSSWALETDGGFPYRDTLVTKNLTATAAASFHGKLWALGGETYDYSTGSITAPIHHYSAWMSAWSSPDGVTWTDALALDPAGQWPARAMTRAAVFNDRLWICGGGFCLYGDVWRMEDVPGDYRAPWTRTLDDGAAFSGRNGHSFVAFRGRLWVFLGFSCEKVTTPPDMYGNTRTYYRDYYPRDVWSSADGAHWVKAGDGL